jgi:hypothetical protein
MLKTESGDPVRPEGFTIPSFDNFVNRQGARGFPEVLFWNERVFVFTSFDRPLTDGAPNVGVYTESFAAAIVPIPEIDDNGFKLTDSSDEANPADA